MKRITLSLTMALGCLMTTQSFGFDLLDRMLGSKGCGCDTACCDTPVVHAPAPACGCEAPCGGLLTGLKGRGCGVVALGCGCEAPACGCAAAPSCGIAAPACGCEAPACGCDSVGSCLPRHGGLLSRLFSRGGGCCDAPCAVEPSCGCAAPACGCETACAAPACGCEPACAAPCGCDSGCDSGCGCGLRVKRPGLLAKLFSSRQSCCDAPCDSGCGCAVPTAVPTSVPAVKDVPTAPAPIVDPSASLQSKSRVLQASARYVR